MKNDARPPWLIAFAAGLLWAFAFFLSLGTIAPLEIERLAAVMVGLLSLAPLLFCGSALAQRRVAATGTGQLVLLLWLLIIVSCAWSVAPPVSLIYAGVFSVFPATVLALIVAETDARQSFLRAAAMGTGVVITGLAVWALVQVFFIPAMLINGQVRDPFANPNVFSALLSLGVFAGLGLYLRGGPRMLQIMTGCAVMIILCAFVAMAGRAASIGMAVGLMALAALCGPVSLRKQWRGLLAMTMVAVATETAIAFMLPGRKSLVNQMAAIVDGTNLSGAVRMDIWRATLDLIGQHPLLGWGYRTFYLTYPSVRLPGEVYSSGAMAHSDPLQLWAEIGILGPVLFYAIGIAALWRFIVYRRAGGRDKLAIALFTGCGVMAAHAHVDFPFYAMPLLMVFGLAFGAMLTVTGEALRQPFAFMARWPREAAQLALIAPVIAFLLLFIPLMLGEYQTNRAEDLLRQGDVAGFGDAINAANHAGFGLNDRPTLLAASVPLGVLQGRQTNKAEQRQLFRQIDGLLSRAEQRNARMPAVWHQRGVMLLSLDADIPPPGYPDAVTCFQKALDLNPLYIESRLRLADLYWNRNERQKAFALLEAGLGWPYQQAVATPYYDRLQEMATVLDRQEILPAIDKARQRQAGFVAIAEAHRRAKDKTGLSTGN